MGNQDIMQFIMIGILLLCGYIFLFQMVAHRTENKSNIVAIAIILLFIYLLVTIPVVVIIGNMGSTEMMLIAIMLLFSCAALFISVYGIFTHFREINKGMLALLLVYSLAVAYVTIFSRQRVNSNSTGERGIYLFRFEKIQEAIRTRSLDPLQHMLLNVAMFIPFGALLPMIYPAKLSKWSYALLLGMMLTTLIEFTQMMLRLGQADLTDIVTNILGAWIGYLIYVVYARLSRERLEKTEP